MSNFFPYNDEHGNVEEIKVNKRFIWGEAEITVPAVSVCEKGIFVDFIKKTENEALREFFKKWYRENDIYTREEREEIEREHPLNFDGRFLARINGKAVRTSRSNSNLHIPRSCLPDSAPYYHSEAEEFLKYYNLDENCGYNFYRAFFPWEQEEIVSLTVHLEACPVHLPCGKFVNTEVHETFKLKNPFTGEEHILTVKEFEKRKISKNLMHDDMVYPDNHICISYEIKPDLSDREFHLRDCKESDSPKNLQGNTVGGAFGIIGGADKSEENEIHHAASSFHFDDFSEVEWQAVFSKKAAEDVEVELI